MSNAPVLDPQFAPFLAAMAQIPPLSQRTLAEIRTAWDLSVFGEFDPLRDEGLAYGKRLAAAGNDVTLLHYPSMPHGFFSFYMLVEAAGKAFREIAAALRQQVAQCEVSAEFVDRQRMRGGGTSNRP